MHDRSASILDHPLIAARYFFPERVPMVDATMVDTGHAQLACYHAAPHGPNALTLLHFHGNGEIVADCRRAMGDGRSILDDFVDIGVNVFLAEYRGYGASTGEPRLVGMFDDLPSIVAATGVPTSRIVLFGRSVGSIYAIECARRWPDVAGLVIESGIHDVRERLLLRVTPAELNCTNAALDAAVGAHLNHGAKLAIFHQPLLLLHTVHDDLVDISHARRNLAAAGGASKKLVAFPDGDHNTILWLNREAYRRELKAFVDTLR